LAEIYSGETYDARLEQAGWNTAGFDASRWTPVAVAQGRTDDLVAPAGPPVRGIQEIKPIKILKTPGGDTVVDMGQNMVGWVRLKAQGPAGTTITLRHAEVLDKQGNFYTENLRAAKAALRYTLKGGGPEVYEPHFTFMGFRYVAVDGYPGDLTLDSLTGSVVHSDMAVTGTLETSKPLVNQLQHNIQWGQKGNFLDVPTDCPQRDERLGWTGDMQVFCGAACFNMDMAAFLGKWLRDIADGQSVDGQMPDFAPHPYDPDTRFSGNPGWGCAAPVVAWKLYSIYGDRRLLEEMFEPCARFVRAIHRENPNLIWRPRTFPFTYGDWLDADTLKLDGWPTKGGEVPKDLYATAFFAHDADLVARMARVLGRDSESREFETLARKIRDQFNQEFVSTDATIKGDTQAGYALALAFDLLPENQRERAAGHMVDALKPYGGALSTGFQSTLRMMLALTRFGHHKQAYALITRREMPSWGYMVEHGGTTIWERWDGFVEGRGFQNAGMNSFCHYAIGAVGEWMYRVIGGINPDESQPGFKRLIIRPIPGGGLTWAKCAYRSIRGRIATHWQVDPATGKFSLDLTIPPNMSAVVDVPGASPVEVGSGSHGFQSQLDRSGR
jgi:alpha-L-rhamnosidase